MELGMIFLILVEDIVKIGNIFNHFAHLCSMVVLRPEILADPVLERFCLADINDFSALVFHDIHAGGKRKLHRLVSERAQLRVNHNAVSFLFNSNKK